MSATDRLHISWPVCLYTEIKTQDVGMSLQYCNKMVQTHEYTRVKKIMTALIGVMVT